MDGGQHARVALLAIVGAAAACGLEVRGDLEVIPLPPSHDDGGPDDSGASAPDRDALCVVTIDDALGSIDETRWMRVFDAEADASGLPKIETVDGQKAVVLAKEGVRWARGAIWLRNAVPTTAFDVAFDFKIDCENDCADGLAAAWLDTTSEQALGNANEAGTLGIPANVRGGAVAVDIYRNGQSNDDPTPNIQILDIDGVRAPGDYDWSVQTSNVYPSIDATGHHVELRLRDGQVRVVMDGVAVREAKVTSAFEGTFGFTAATGGVSATFAVHHLRAKFYRCDVPP
jgi:hypothetical protein